LFFFNLILFWQISITRRSIRQTTTGKHIQQDKYMCSSTSTSTGRYVN